LNTCAAKLRESSSRDGGVRVFDRGYDAFDPRFGDGLGARAGAARSRARFESDVERCATRRASGFPKRNDFGVIPTVVRVEAFTDDSSALQQYGSNERIRMRERRAAEG
jgi:hypothetical protein